MATCLLRVDIGANVCFVLLAEMQRLADRHSSIYEHGRLFLLHLSGADLRRIDGLAKCNFPLDLGNLSDD
ncbi:hypothetical protein AX761_22015 [Rhizobium sp. 58]|nr:hypothetical protein AX761_22015 [Rhizobium sp. 58]